ncbi:glutamine-hydrolyzing carbamoyl-phosphate synthase small subunit [Candidatus Micrarchaeota archaeon]|nr:glutamine-hydrolyzing carbamoyl-phosphate synthase small subunit [Candidatus Micrarchaeota archaeon]
MYSKKVRAKLVLSDNTVFLGYSFGFPFSSSGEVVFSTGMTGYPESLTDPSYSGQILVFTYPLIGNYGIPAHNKKNVSNLESEKIQVKGLIVGDYSEEFSHWSAEKSLSSWLKENKVPAIFGVDSRALTQKLRSKGTMLGKIIIEKEIPFFDPNKLNLVEKVSCSKNEWFGKGNKKVALVDFGAKHGIIRSLLKRKIKILRVPWNSPLNELDVDGFVLSNGPGDPSLLSVPIQNIKKLFSDSKPVFGICLGNQLLGRAAGINTFKLKFGHRSQNQPCINLETNNCIITSQNHGFALENKMKNDFVKWFVNANDKTIEGIKHKSKPFFSVQFHPEASPGPTDSDFLFDEFKEML